jgi:hypothetical protein
MSHVLSRALISSKQGTCEAWRGPEEIVFAISTGVVRRPLYRRPALRGTVISRQILPGAFDLIAK